ncbi:MAG: SUMF1/EgtB/PvdO family nonheme iron enzyme, partial [Kiritimatiellae bacterium]|nr:SUMF1/EgtB/PvdO family nonheme iron enzyme [Kiritimatiellia bacterium]
MPETIMRRARRAGSGAVKVEAEAWPYAAEMLAKVEKTGAAKDPEYALYTASRVSHEWAARRMPAVVVPPKPVPGLRASRQSAVAVGSGSRQWQSAVGSGSRQSESGVLGPGSPSIADHRALIANHQSPVTGKGADWPEHEVENARERVTAWSVDAPPLYCAVDITAGSSAQAYPVCYYTSAEGVPGGVTNELYKTLRILMRRIGPTGGEGFTMGSPVNETGRTAAREAQVQAVLTKGYYAGVYEVTQGQWYQVMGDTAQAWPSKWSNNDYKLTRPVEQVSYYDIRENINNTDDAAVGWP